MKNAINSLLAPLDLVVERTLTRVFIVGCPRSGTTLLQSLLAANSNVSSFPESHFFENLFSERRLLYQCGLASRKARLHWKRVMQEIGHPELADAMPKYTPFVRQYTRAFLNILDNSTINQGKRIWLEKTPGHLRHIRQIEQLVPGAKFIHILRDGADNIASMYEVSQHYPESWGESYSTLDQCIVRWIEDARISLACRGLENQRVIEYARLVDAPEEVLRELCQFIGLIFEPGMLENYADSAAHIILEKEAWKSSVYGKIQKASLSKFDTFLDAGQREYVLAHIPADLKSLVRPAMGQGI